MSPGSTQPSLQSVMSQHLARLRVIIDVPREYTTQSPTCGVTVHVYNVDTLTINGHSTQCVLLVLASQYQGVAESILMLLFHSLHRYACLISLDILIT